MTQPTIEMTEATDGTPLAMYDYGGDGVPVLFVHATGFCAPTWAPVVEHLRGVHAVALDVRYHGRSGRGPDDGFSWDVVADDVATAVDHFGLEAAVGVGHSMGGALLVLTEAARPGTFRGIWGYEPIIFPPEIAALADDAENPLAAGAARRRATFESRAAARANFASKPPMSNFAPAALDAYLDGGFATGEDGVVTLRCAPADESRFYLMGSRHEGWDRLPDLHCPVWVAVGNEGFGPAAMAPEIAARLAHGRLVEHPTLAHFGPMQDPSAIAAELEVFLATLG